MRSGKRAKTFKRKSISKWIQLWIGPLGWALLIIWYVLNLSKGCGEVAINHAPTIQEGIRLSQPVVPVGETVTARVIVNDPDAGDEISYFWAAQLGKIGEQLNRFEGPKVIYVAPDQPCVDFITVIVYDREGKTDKEFRAITVTERGKR